MTSPAPTEKALQLIRALADMIIEVAETSGPMGAPSGVVYAAMNGYGVSLDVYQTILRTLQSAGRIEVKGDLITVPKKGAA